MKAPESFATSSFPVVDDEIQVGAMPLSELAARVGRTPFYAYDRATLASRVQLLREVLPREIVLHYAMKANPMPPLVSFMADLVDGLDVASGGEMRVALEVGMDPKQISFAGPGKTEAELEQSVGAGILVNVESFREIGLLERIVQKVGRPARVAVRVNPDFELKASGMKMGGGPKQFGIDAEQVPAALREIRQRGLAFEGFHIFSGSQNLRHDAISDGFSNGTTTYLMVWFHVAPDLITKFTAQAKLLGYQPQYVFTLPAGGARTRHTAKYISKNLGVIRF